MYAYNSCIFMQDIFHCVRPPSIANSQVKSFMVYIKLGQGQFCPSKVTTLVWPLDQEP